MAKNIDISISFDIRNATQNSQKNEVFDTRSHGSHQLASNLTVSKA
jgi:hypothetical protein